MGKTSQSIACRCGTKVAALVGAIVLGAIAMPAPASAQGFFDFLFGGQRYQRSVVAYAPDPGFDVPRNPERAQKHVRLSPAIEQAVGGKPEKKPPPVVGKGPLGPFINDPTLRAGDVVVTSHGLMVYRGGAGTTHSSREFVGLSKAAGIAGNRETLASIEKANRFAAATGTAAVQPASSEPIKQASAETPRLRQR